MKYLGSVRRLISQRRSPRGERGLKLVWLLKSSSKYLVAPPAGSVD